MKFLRWLFGRREPVPARVLVSDQYEIEGGHVLDLHYDDGWCRRRIVADGEYRRGFIPAFARRATRLEDAQCPPVWGTRHAFFQKR